VGGAGVRAGDEGAGSGRCRAADGLAPGARRAWWGERELRLTKTEFDLLELLVRTEGLVLDHETVYRQVWGNEVGVDAKNLASYVGYLRRKLAEAGAPDLIHTVRGVGYAARRP
jgi:two-component system response regulator MprA